MARPRRPAPWPVRRWHWSRYQDPRIRPGRSSSRTEARGLRRKPNSVNESSMFNSLDLAKLTAAAPSVDARCAPTYGPDRTRGAGTLRRVQALAFCNPLPKPWRASMARGARGLAFLLGFFGGLAAFAGQASAQ